MFGKILATGLACVAAASALTINTAEGWLESAYVEWSPVSGAASYNVYVDGVKIDNPLVRSYGSYMRADAVGLKEGFHTIKVAPVTNGTEGAADSKTVEVKSHDRAGFAFNGLVDGKKVNRIPGAYNTDGTLKSGAVVVYISENSKNKVSADVIVDAKGNKTSCKTFQGILTCMKKGYETRPFDFRIIGNVTDPDSLDQGDLLIDLGSSENSYVTVEGIGNDATVNGWGIRVKNAQNVEIRNLGIMNVNSHEGDNVGLQQNNQFVWVHNNDFFYGHAGSDKDQVKGDGALDCKKSTNVTFSYNHFWDNGKSNLLGLSEGTTAGLYITYHHNWYDHSDSRHPRVRYYSAHVYNNYYDGNSKYGIGSTLGSSIFAEGNYFRNCKYPMLTSMQGSDVYAGTTKRDPANYGTFSGEAGGSIKAFNNHIEGGTFIAYGTSKYILKGSETSIGAIDSKNDFDAYVVKSRTQEMPSTAVSFLGSNKHNNFDLNLPYTYTADAPADAKANVTNYAGRIKGGDFKWTFTSADDESHVVNQLLKDALVAYVGKVKTIQGDGSVIVNPVTSSASVASSSSQAKSSSSVKQSSSSVAQSSSSVKQSSSSIAQSSSSVRDDEDVVEEEITSTLPISKSISHNFTDEGASSDYFEFMGNLATKDGSRIYEGVEYSRYFKMETITQITFTLAKPATMTLIFNEDFVKRVRVDGDKDVNKHTATAGVVTLELEAGTHVVTKNDVARLYMISIEMDENENPDPEENPVVGSSASSDDNELSSSSNTEIIKNSSSSKEESDGLNAQGFAKNALFFKNGRLTLNVIGLQRVNIMSMTGRVVYSGSTNVVDLSSQPAGMYIVQVKTGYEVFLRRILKK